jgi:hypothetical protein
LIIIPLFPQTKFPFLSLTFDSSWLGHKP